MLRMNSDLRNSLQVPPHRPPLELPWVPLVSPGSLGVPWGARYTGDGKRLQPIGVAFIELCSSYERSE